MNPPAAAPASTFDLQEVLVDLLAAMPAESLGTPLDLRYWEAALLDPARDILRRPGKGFRSQLVASSWALAGGTPGQQPQELQFLVELLHAGSLVIDDIEDASETRRGEPSLHRRFGLPLALNTGNWLHFLPLALLSRLGLQRDLALALYADIADAVVLSHQGQALDLSLRVTSLRQSEVPAFVAQVTQLKTGALLRLAALMGARAAGAAPETLTALAHFGTRVGFVLQMADDWSGIAVDRRRNKGFEDLQLGRPTWPWAWLAESRDPVGYAGIARAAELAAAAPEVEEVLLRLRAQLHQTAPGLIAATMQGALHELVRVLGPSPALDDLAEQVQRLSQAYG